MSNELPLSEYFNLYKDTDVNHPQIIKIKSKHNKFVTRKQLLTDSANIVDITSDNTILSLIF